MSRNSITLAMFPCMGGEQVIMAAGESADPWNDLPAVTSFVYLIPLSIYPIAVFSAGANVNYANPHLARPWGEVNIPLSPFSIAAAYSKLHPLYYVLNFCFMVCAYTTAYAQRFSASLSTS
jgi:yeast amino acid transporter